jgi:hypothetical protein
VIINATVAVAKGQAPSNMLLQSHAGHDPTCPGLQTPHVLLAIAYHENRIYIYIYNVIAKYCMRHERSLKINCLQEAPSVPIAGYVVCYLECPSVLDLHIRTLSG